MFFKGVSGEIIANGFSSKTPISESPGITVEK